MKRFVFKHSIKRFILFYVFAKLYGALVALFFLRACNRREEKTLTALKLDTECI